MNQQTVTTPLETTTISPTSSGILQRKCACGNHTVAGSECAECRQKRLQRKATNQNEPGTVPPIVHEVLRSPGQPLDSATRAFMEPRFGHDFSQVRVHTDGKAAESARSVHALAYTVGRDIVFGNGQHAPQAGQGQRLMVHELTHVVQQQQVSSQAIQALAVTPPNDSFEREADLTADQVTSFGLLSGEPLRQKQAVVSRQLDDQTTGKPSSIPLKQRPGGMLPYREATELATCIRIMGEENAEYCRQEVLGEKPQPRRVEITREGGGHQTFISTDTLTFMAQMVNPLSGTTPPTRFNWTVNGVSPNAGGGNPHSATGQARFSFRPNPTHRPTSGSRAPNDPVQYQVDATAAGGVGTFELVQDETDIIRQEYIDLGPKTPPARSNIVTPTNATYNVGNYSLIVDGGMDNAFTNTETEFQVLTPAGATAPAIAVSSGYRNPRRNVAAGSNFPVTSRHVWGTALDLTVPGANATLWTRLRMAGTNAGNTSICEDGPTQIGCNQPNVDHVHIQW